MKLVDKLKMRAPSIDKNLLPIKGHYFLWNAGTAPVQPFLGVYAKQRGFSSFVMGLVYTITPISGLIAKPLFGAIADRWKCQKGIFMAMLALTAAAFISILYAPALEEDAEVSFSCDYSEAVFDTCAGNASTTGSRLDPKVLAAKLASLPDISVKCNFKCPFDAAAWDTVEKYWSARRDDNTSVFSFSSQVPLGKVDNLNTDCVYFKVDQVILENGAVVKPLCPDKDIRVRAVCNVSCPSTYVKEFLPTARISDDEVLGTHQFWIFLSLMVLAWVGQAVVVSISDTICFEMLGSEPHKYGHQRMFGSLGWGIFSVISGFIVDAASKGEENKNYTWTFYLSLVMLLLDILVSTQFRPKQQHRSQNILRDVASLLTHVRIVIFVFWCVFMGMCTAVIWNFLFWMLEDIAGTDNDWIKTLEGIIMFVDTFGGELPLFFLSSYILKKIGHVNCMTLILAAMGTRFTLYSLLTNVWWVLPIELLNGITFALFWACMASYSSIVAPPGCATTVQGLTGAVFEGIGVSSGSFLAGAMIDSWGGQWTFRVFGIMAFVMCLVHAGVQWLVGRRNKDLDRYVTPDDDPNSISEYSQELKLMET